MRFYCIRTCGACEDALEFACATVATRGKKKDTCFFRFQPSAFGGIIGEFRTRDFFEAYLCWGSLFNAINCHRNLVEVYMWFAIHR